MNTHMLLYCFIYAIKAVIGLQGSVFLTRKDDSKAGRESSNDYTCLAGNVQAQGKDSRGRQ